MTGLGAKHDLNAAEQSHSVSALYLRTLHRCLWAADRGIRMMPPSPAKPIKRSPCPAVDEVCAVGVAPRMCGVQIFRAVYSRS